MYAKVNDIQAYLLVTRNDAEGRSCTLIGDRQEGISFPGGSIMKLCSQGLPEAAYAAARPQVGLDLRFSLKHSFIAAMCVDASSGLHLRSGRAGQSVNIKLYLRIGETSGNVPHEGTPAFRNPRYMSPGSARTGLLSEDLAALQQFQGIGAWPLHAKLQKEKGQPIIPQFNTMRNKIRAFNVNDEDIDFLIPDHLLTKVA